MRRGLVPLLALCAAPVLAAPLLAAPTAAKDFPAPAVIGYEGVAMTLDEMNAYFRGKSCSGAYGRKVFFGDDGSFRDAYPDLTSEGDVHFRPRDRDRALCRRQLEMEDRQDRTIAGLSSEGDGPASSGLQYAVLRRRRAMTGPMSGCGRSARAGREEGLLLFKRATVQQWRDGFVRVGEIDRCHFR